MKFIKELTVIDRTNLCNGISQHHHAGDIRDALNRRYCYSVEIYPEDYARILINSSVYSSTQDVDLSYCEYPTLKDIIESLMKNKDFFGITRMNGKLSGSKVKYYFDKYNAEIPVVDLVFLIDRREFLKMNPIGDFYVRDGMHRLVALGLASGYKREFFPVYGYFSTNEKAAPNPAWC